MSNRNIFDCPSYMDWFTFWGNTAVVVSAARAVLHAVPGLRKATLGEVQIGESIREHFVWTCHDVWTIFDLGEVVGQALF